MPDADAFLDSFTPAEYRELLASEQLDPDPFECLLATLRIGFSVLATQIASANAGEVVEVPPSLFDPTAKPTRGARDVHVVGPNQMAKLLSGVVPLIR